MLEGGIDLLQGLSMRTPILSSPFGVEVTYAHQLPLLEFNVYLENSVARLENLQGFGCSFGLLGNLGTQEF